MTSLVCDYLKDKEKVCDNYNYIHYITNIILIIKIIVNMLKGVQLNSEKVIVTT